METGLPRTGETSRPRPLSADRCPDAILVIPGIMGSALREVDSGELVWGLGSLRWYAKAWAGREGLTTLHVTEAEREGRIRRIKPYGLLRGPAFAPLFGLIEPYTALVEGLRKVTLHPAAVAEFDYDWRLAVPHNARRLAAMAHEHLRNWRARSRSRQARLVLVAHSTGGLLARALGSISGATDDVRLVITLGTPFHGSVKAAMILNGAARAPLPLPRRKLHALAATFPGVHDLLPTYRCVDKGDDFVKLTPEDVGELGGDEDLAQESAELHEELRRLTMPEHRAVIGVRQPTPQSLEIKDGVAYPRFYAPKSSGGELLRDEHGRPRRFDRYGDGTVSRDAALIGDFQLAAQHGGLARSSAVINQVCDIITDHEHDLGTATGGTLGLHVPDVVAALAPWRFKVTGTRVPASVTCSVTDAVTGREVCWPELRNDGGPVKDVEDDPGDDLDTGSATATVTLPGPGLYRVTVAGGGGAPIAQLVLATAPTMPTAPAGGRSARRPHTSQIT